jgi:hypothetical protein
MENIDAKILFLIEKLKELEIIKSEMKFCESIELKRQNLTRIKKGVAHFTPVHIQNVCKVFKVNANWIFDIEKNTFLK